MISCCTRCGCMRWNRTRHKTVSESRFLFV
nr:MAG TPA: Variant erythrocyte surface antigen-1 [Caudoviricetes sp.]